MILEGTTLQGTMHKQYEVANQDAFQMEKIHEYYAAVVCDGVSLKSDYTFSNSELAAQYCANKIMDFLKDALKPDMSNKQIEETLGNCLKETVLGLEDYLEQENIPFYDCQTTALLMVYHNGKLFSALAGDGGIIFRLASGHFGMLVTRVKTSSSVEPICYPPGWRFYTVDMPGNPVVEAILATDGIFDNLSQSFRGDITLNQALIDDLLSIQDIHPPHRQRALTETVRNIETHDDKTVVVLISEDGDYPDPQASEQMELLDAESYTRRDPRES